jgi:threonine dehydrogenase-like Zn-dependent dehydrogenase
VHLAGVCSTDLEMVRGYYPFEGIPGHEFIGLVADENGHPGLRGNRVVGDINISCGTCERCLCGGLSQCVCLKTLGIFNYNGVFAEYSKLPAKNLVSVPDSVSDVLAVFIEPTATALRILDQVRVKPSDRVIVVGAGRLRLLITQALKNTGCDLKVVVRRPEPAAILEGWGIQALTAAEVKGDLADIVVEVTGSPEGFALSWSLTHARGTLVLKSTFAGELSIDLSHCVVDEITLIGSRCGNYQAGLQALTSGLIQVGEMVDSFFSLDQGSEAISHTSQPDFESADQGLKAIHLYCGFGILIQVQNGFAF